MNKGRYQEFRLALKKKHLVLDGSMGALLQAKGLPAGYAPDLWNLERPDQIKSVHREYVRAGADILITNTFGSSRWRLADYQMSDRLVEINQAAVIHSQSVIQKGEFVFGDIGPCGDTVFPTGRKTFSEVRSLFSEQAQILIHAGVDGIIVETMFDSIEFKAALSAIRSISLDIPVIALMTLNSDGLSDTGIGAQSVVALSEGFHVDAVGVNCSVGPDAMVPIVKQMKDIAVTPIVVQPNAGMPELKKGLTVFPLNAEKMADYIEPFFKQGVHILGGCCGTTPDFINKIRLFLDQKGAEYFSFAQPRSSGRRVLLSSKNQIVPIGPQFPFVMIGEKINPTGRKKVAEKIKNKNIEALIADAFIQVEAGAQCLDVNVGVPLIDEPAMMEATIVALQNAIDIPLVIDSSFSEGLLTGGRVYYGRPLLNSINAESEKLSEVLPVMREVGGAVLALVTETEVPEKAVDRLKYAQVILERLLKAGFNKNDIVFDVLALTVSAMREGAKQSLETIELIARELDCVTVFGCSNSSFGLPNRRFVHQAFLTMAIERGLDSAIMNVLERDVAIRVAAASLFSPRQFVIEDYLQRWSNPIKESSTEKAKVVSNSDQQGPVFLNQFDSIEKEIFWDVVEGRKDKIVDDVKEFIRNRSEESFDLFLKVLTPGIRYLGDLFSKRIRFIPHLVAAAEAMKVAVELLEPHMIEKRKKGNEHKGTIVFATVKGDIHDIGKNICVLMLKNFGYHVIDMGKNVSIESIFETAKKEKAQIVALSALMTTTMVQMKLFLEKCKSQDMGFKVMVGGAPVTRDFALEIGADGYSEDVGNIVGETEKLFSSLGYQCFQTEMRPQKK